MTNAKPQVSKPGLTALLLAGLLLTACSGESILNLWKDDTEATNAISPMAVPPRPTATPLPNDATTAAHIRARGYLRVGVRYDLYPFGYVTDEGEIAGFDVDLGRELARRWLGDAQAVQFRQVRSDTAIEHLRAGDVDVILAALTHTQNREAGADFSLPYFIDGQALLVRASDTTPIGSPADLAGRPVGVTRWGKARETIEATVPFTLSFQTYDRFDAAALALGAGEIDAVVDLRRRLFWGKHLVGGTETAIVGQYTTAPVSIVYPSNEPFLADLINLTLQEMIADGTYADLYAHWFAPELPPSIERWPGEGTLDLLKAPVTANAPDTITAIGSRGRLAVALADDRPPFAFVDADGTPAGYEVDLVRQLAARWLGDPAAVDFVPAPVETGKEMLQSSQADLLIGAVPHTRSDELRFDFSLTTYVAGEGLLVQAGTTLTTFTSLKERQVAVVSESGSRETLLAAAQREDISLTVLPKPTLAAAIASLHEGQVTAVAGDRVSLLASAYATPGLSVPPLRMTQVPLAIGLPPGDSAFRDLVNLTLQRMKTDEQFDELYSTWFFDSPPALEIWPGAPYRELQLQTAAGP